MLEILNTIIRLALLTGIAFIAYHLWPVIEAILGVLTKLASFFGG